MEMLNNNKPNIIGFKRVDFDPLWVQAVDNAFTMNSTLNGNQRNYATINDDVPQPQRLKKLDEPVIQQIRILSEDDCREYLK